MARPEFKQKVFELLETLPDEAGWDELAEAVETMIDVAVSLDQFDRELGISQEEIEREFLGRED